MIFDEKSVCEKCHHEAYLVVKPVYYDRQAGNWQG